MDNVKFVRNLVKGKIAETIFAQIELLVRNIIKVRKAGF
jgi:hypothetical protein